MSLFKSLRSLGRPLVVHRQVAAAFGLLEGHFLEQIAYWMDKTEEKADQWVYKTSEEIESETSLTYKQQIRIRAKLVKLSVLEERYDRALHCIFFRVHEQKFDSLVERAYDERLDAHLTEGKLASDQKSEGTLPKVSSYKGTEITQEITQEIAPSAPRTVLEADQEWENYQERLKREGERLAAKAAKKGRRPQRNGFQKEVPRVEEKRARSTGAERAALAAERTKVLTSPDKVSARVRHLLSAGTAERGGLRNIQAWAKAPIPE